MVELRVINAKVGRYTVNIQLLSDEEKSRLSQRRTKLLRAGWIGLSSLAVMGGGLGFWSLYQDKVTARDEALQRIQTNAFDLDQQASTLNGLAIGAWVISGGLLTWSLHELFTRPATPQTRENVTAQSAQKTMFSWGLNTLSFSF